MMSDEAFLPTCRWTGPQPLGFTYLGDWLCSMTENFTLLLLLPVFSFLLLLQLFYWAAVFAALCCCFGQNTLLIMWWHIRTTWSCLLSLSLLKLLPLLQFFPRAPLLLLLVAKVAVEQNSLLLLSVANLSFFCTNAFWWCRDSYSVGNSLLLCALRIVYVASIGLALFSV